MGYGPRATDPDVRAGWELIARVFGEEPWPVLPAPLNEGRYTSAEQMQQRTFDFVANTPGYVIWSTIEAPADVWARSTAMARAVLDSAPEATQVVWGQAMTDGPEVGGVRSWAVMVQELLALGTSAGDLRGVDGPEREARAGVLARCQGRLKALAYRITELSGDVEPY